MNYDIYYKNGVLDRLNLTPQKNGLYRLTHTCFDPDGYYNPSASFTQKNWDFYRFLDEIEKIKEWKAVKKVAKR